MFNNRFGNDSTRGFQKRSSEINTLPLLSLFLSRICLLALIICGGGCGGGASGTGIQVDGKLIEINSRMPIAGAVIRLPEEDQSTITDSQGSFSFENVSEERTLLLQAVIDGELVQANAFELPANSRAVILTVEYDRNNQTLIVNSQPPQSRTPESANPTATNSPAQPSNPIPTIMATPQASLPGPVQRITPIATIPPGAPPIEPSPTSTPSSTPTPRVTLTSTPTPTMPPQGPVPDKPTITSPAYRTTNQSSILFQGTKQSGTGIQINGVLVVEPNPQTTWQANQLLVEGSNTISVSAISPTAQLSAPATVIMTRDSIPPTILSVLLVPGAVGDMTAEVVTDGSVGYSYSISPSTQDTALNWQSQSNVETLSLQTLQNFLANHSSSDIKIKSQRFDWSGPGKITISVHDGFANYSSTSFYFDSRLLKQHPLAPTKVYFADQAGGYIGVQTEEASISNALTQQIPAGEAQDIAIDPIERNLYWLDKITSGLFRMDLKGNNPTRILTVAASASHLIIDQVARQVYWLEDVNGLVLKSARLDGTNIKTPIRFAGITSAIEDLTIDHVRQKIYWSDATQPRIWRANIDGTQIETFYDGNSGAKPSRIVIDPVGSGRLYWSDAARDEIRCTKLDGTGTETVVAIPGEKLSAIEVDGSLGELYWAAKGNAAQPGTIVRWNIQKATRQLLVIPSDSHPNALALGKATYRISGHLLDGDKPLADIIVRGYSSKLLFDTRTNQQGVFSADNLPFGIGYQLQFLMPDGRQSLQCYKKDGTPWGCTQNSTLTKDTELNINIRDVPYNLN